MEPAARPAPSTEPATKPTTKAPKPPAPRPPVIGTVSSVRRLSCDGPWCTLSPATGTVTFRSEVTGATRVEFFLVPTGTGTWDLRWAYPDEPVMAHLMVVARGPGGTATRGAVQPRARVTPPGGSAIPLAGLRRG